MKNCPMCNALNNDENQYCEVCGASLAVSRGTNYEQPAQEPPVQNAYYAQPQAQPQAQSQAQSQAQPQPQQPPYGYQQPPFVTPYGVNEAMLPDEYKPVSVLTYIGYNILFCIPLIGFIVLLVTAFSGNQKKSLKNYARAVLIMGLISFALCFIVGIVMAIFGAGALDYYY